MSKHTHEWEHEGVVYSFSWLGDVDVRPDRVYAIAFTSEGKILLVTNSQWTPACWLPGGGVEEGETPGDALARELREEANASIHWPARIGSQRTDSSTGERHFITFYWCRVTLEDDFSPQHEISERYLVKPDEFLDRLYWGRNDPNAPLLLERALAIEQSQSSGAGTTSFH